MSTIRTLTYLTQASARSALELDCASPLIVGAPAGLELECIDSITLTLDAIGIEIDWLKPYVHLALKMPGTGSYVFWGLYPLVDWLGTKGPLLVKREDALEHPLVYLEDPFPLAPNFTMEDADDATLTVPVGLMGLGYELVLSSVACVDGMDRGVAPEPERLRSRWIRAEVELARERLRANPLALHQVLPAGSFQVDTRGWIGLPWEDHLELFRGKQGELRDGTLWLPPVKWIHRILEVLPVEIGKRIDQRTQFARALFDKEPVLVTIRTRILRLIKALPSAIPKPSVGVRSTTPIIAINPVSDIEDLMKTMPACMKELATEAFEPSVKSHLRFEDRNIFYRFALANGTPADKLTQALADKFSGPIPPPSHNYIRTTIQQGVKTTQAFVSKAGPTYTGDGCKKLMQTTNKHGMSYCPFMRGTDEKNARVCCHKAMETITKKKQPMGEAWPQGFPLRVAQYIRANAKYTV